MVERRNDHFIIKRTDVLQNNKGVKVPGMAIFQDKVFVR